MANIKIGTIKGIDVLMNRSGKVSTADTMVTRGTGVHTPHKFKTKTKQKSKNDMKKYIG